MTLEEAKKILENEGFHMALASKVINQTGAIREFEKPEVCEAIEVANVNKWTVSLSPIEWNQREARLKKEYEKNTKAPGPGEEQPKENVLKAATDAFILQANEIMRLKKKNAELLEAIDKMKEGNPALKESASQFNEALLGEQAKKIKEQDHELTRLISLVEKKENSISRLYYEKSVLEKENEELKKGEIPARYFDKALVDEQEEKIKKLEHEKLDILEIAGSCKRIAAEQSNEIKRLGKEIFKLNGIIHDKNAILSDVAEELRLTKIREKNLTEVGQKYMKENEELKEQLADNVVDKINANALKSAESALACKEKEIAEKDEMIHKMAEVIVHKSPVTAEFFSKCWILAYGKVDYKVKVKAPEPELVSGESASKELRYIMACNKDIINLLEDIKRLWQE